MKSRGFHGLYFIALHLQGKGVISLSYKNHCKNWKIKKNEIGPYLIDVL